MCSRHRPRLQAAVGVDAALWYCVDLKSGDRGSLVAAQTLA